VAISPLANMLRQRLEEDFSEEESDEEEFEDLEVRTSSQERPGPGLDPFFFA
jgi:hypothetical protein